jgi:hypothetical protein
MTCFRNSGFVATIGATLIAFSSSVANAERQPLWEGCRVASKTEYESAKRDFLLQTSFGTYARTGHWWRHYYWYCRL